MGPKYVYDISVRSAAINTAPQNEERNSSECSLNIKHYVQRLDVNKTEL